MHTILVPLDGSPLAERALPVALGLARRGGGTLELATVHEPALPVRGGQGAPVFDQRFDAELRAGLRRYLDATARRLGDEPDAPVVRTVLLAGAPGKALARHARRTCPDLVVLTTHGRGGASRWWLGSVAESLVRRLTSPVLLLRPAADEAARPVSGGSFRRLLVPLDGTPAAESALDLAASFAATFARSSGEGEPAELTLLRVVLPLHPVLRAIAPEGEYARDLAEQQRHAERYLGAVAERARRRHPGVRVHTATRVELSPPAAITACASELAAEVVVMATHGRGLAGRVLLGSVADKVLRTSPVPVLFCRAAPADARLAERVESVSVGTADVRAPGPSPERAIARQDGVRRIAVALDFAAPSRAAAEWVARHFADAELVLAHAVHIPEPPAYLETSLPARAELLEDARRGAEVRLREFSVGLAPARIWPEVRLGVPVAQIAAVATAYDVDLLVVGEHGKWADATRATLGSTAERLTRAVAVPILLARGLPDGPPRRILAAVDDSPRAEGVLAWTRALAEPFAAEVVLLHVLDPALAGAGDAPDAPDATRDSALLAALREAAACWLERRAATLAPAVRTTACEVAVGEPATEILVAAARREADLLVVGARRAGDDRAPRVGRTAERVLRLGDRSVLVVPERC